jgi:hypothetical protein
MSGEDDLNIFEKTWVLLVGILHSLKKQEYNPNFPSATGKIRFAGRGGGGRGWDGEETKRRRKRRKRTRKKRMEGSRVGRAGG